MAEGVNRRRFRRNVRFPRSEGFERLTAELQKKKPMEANLEKALLCSTRMDQTFL